MGPKPDTGTIVHPQFNRLVLTGVVLAVIFQIAWYALLWQKILSQPNLLHGSDYLALYTGGWLARTQGYPAIYDLALQKKLEEEILGQVLKPDQLLSFNHPPLLIPVLQTITTSDFAASYLRWNFFSGLMICLSLSVMAITLKKMKRSVTEIVLVVLGGLLFYPSVLSILKGQDSFMLVLGAALLFFGLSQNDDRAAGLGLAALTLKPQLALMLGAPFLFTHRKAILWASIGSLIYMPLLAQLGARGTTDFIHVLSLSAGGENYALNRADMFNLAGLLTRAGLAASTITTLAWIGYGASIIILSIVWWRTAPLTLNHLGLAILPVVFFSPHLHYHDLALLLIPVVIASLSLNQKNRAYCAAFPLVISVLLLLLDLTTLPRLIFPYLLMGGLLIWFIKLISYTRDDFYTPHR